MQTIQAKEVEKISPNLEMEQQAGHPPSMMLVAARLTTVAALAGFLFSSGCSASVPIAGGSPTLHVATPVELDGLEVRDGFVYWATKSAGTLNRSDGKGVVVQIASGQPNTEHVVVDGTFAYWLIRLQANDNKFALRKARLPAP